MKQDKETNTKIARLQTWWTRLASYVSMVNFTMIFYLYILESPMGLQWYHWFILVASLFSVIIFVDVKYIFPGTLQYIFNKSPPMVKLKDAVEGNTVLLNKIIDHLEVDK